MNTMCVGDCLLVMRCDGCGSCSRGGGGVVRVNNMLSDMMRGSRVCMVNRVHMSNVAWMRYRPWVAVRHGLRLLVAGGRPVRCR